VNYPFENDLYILKMYPKLCDRVLNILRKFIN